MKKTISVLLTVFVTFTTIICLCCCTNNVKEYDWYYVVLTPKNETEGGEVESQQLLNTRLSKTYINNPVISLDINGKIRIEAPKKYNDAFFKIICGTGRLEFRDYKNIVWLTGEDIKSAYVGMDDGNYVVVMNFNEQGVSKFSEATATISGYSDNTFYVYMDNELIADFLVEMQITTNSTQINNNYTYDEAIALAAVIDTGSLPIEYSISDSGKIERKQSE